MNLKQGPRTPLNGGCAVLVVGSLETGNYAMVNPALA